MAVSTDRYELSTDSSRLDLEVIHRFLAEESYWAKGRDRDVVERSIENSVCVGAFLDGAQVGFARAVTDKATFAWLADVFVLREHRGRGLGKRLVEHLLGDPELSLVNRWLLGTADAHELYRRFGFSEISHGHRLMAIESVEDARRCAAG
jgi:GNAT superfamily N-acetyltransferase